ncbi:MAG: ion transporter [Oxalobacteraceae bacterium]|jgi:voltage-gated potassium channel|nr:ion transporter [Oxalobacteraceae bacterium]
MQADISITAAPASFRQKMYSALLDETSDTGARGAINRFIFLLILLNLLALLLESAPAIEAAYRPLFHWFDLFSVAVFSVEYLLRLYLAPEDPEFAGKPMPRLRYATSFLGLIDLLAILPFFLGLFIALDSRLLRVLRLLRILKITQLIREGLREFIQLNRGRTVRQKVHALLFPSEFGGKLNQTLEVFLIFWIVLSVLSIVLESVESIRGHFGAHFAWLDAASFIVFATEYTLRIYACPEEDRTHSPLLQRFRFFKSPSGLLDLVAILPFMLELVLGGTLDLRFLRIIRMVRLLKLGRYSSASDTMFAVIRKETPVLLAALFMIALLVFMMAAFGYLLERDAQPDKFENIPQSIYWAVITLASVGYGDISPVTPGGRLITVVLALVGIGLFAIPAAIMASGFTDQLRMNREKLKLDLLAEARADVFDEAAREAFIHNAKHHHLTAMEINQLIAEIEKGDDSIETAQGEFESLALAAKNPEFALAQYHTLVSRLRELAAVADDTYIRQQLDKPGQATDLDRAIWQQIDRSRSGKA